jgi:hypothetical protein
MTAAAAQASTYGERLPSATGSASREVEHELGNECDAPGELLVMFHSDVLASRLERFDSKAIN